MERLTGQGIDQEAAAREDAARIHEGEAPIVVPTGEHREDTIGPRSIEEPGYAAGTPADAGTAGETRRDADGLGSPSRTDRASISSVGPRRESGGRMTSPASIDPDRARRIGLGIAAVVPPVVVLGTKAARAVRRHASTPPTPPSLTDRIMGRFPGRG